MSKMSNDILDNNTKSGGLEELIASEDGDEFTDQDIDKSLLMRMANTLEDVRGRGNV